MEEEMLLDGQDQSCFQVISIDVAVKSEIR